jgi:hypothetical protein
MLFEKMPYEIYSESPAGIYEEVVKFRPEKEFEKLEGPERELLCILLHRNPKKRLHGSFKNLQKLSFFKEVDW